VTPLEKVKVVRIDTSTGAAQTMADYVAQERLLQVFLNRTRFATIFCSPSGWKELAVGHAITEGVVKSIAEIERISLNEKKGLCRVTLRPDVNLEQRLKLLQHFSRVIFSACGSTTPYRPTLKLAKIKSDLKVKAGTLLNCANSLNLIAETFRKTGGVHVAAVHRSDGALVTFAEDVGRHNAVDKVIGSCVFDRVDLDSCILTLSGRLTSDIVVKAARVRLPIVASLSAAINSGIAVARDTGLTLVGFVRGKRMNIYTHPCRILLEGHEAL
jgi:FdhD protein